MSSLPTGFFFFCYLFRALGHEARKMRAERQTFCRNLHRFDSFYLKHQASIECRTAELVASFAAEVWEELRREWKEFPDATKSKFLLKVVFDESDPRPGYKVRGTSIAVINLAHHSLDEGGERELRDTLSEELHHVIWHRVFGEKDKEFKFDPEEGPRGVIHYYAFNRHEFEALRFCVRTVGERAELLMEVEEFLVKCTV